MINRKEALNINFPKTIEPVPKKGWSQTTRHYKVIIPLWGGGVKANENDPITLIRGSSIRGHLRFWWRAIRGNSNGSSLAAMRTRENEIWGSTESPSQVKISVQVTKPGSKFQPTNFKNESIQDVGAMNSKDAYVTFPLRLSKEDKINNKPPATLKENVEFELELEYPDSLKKEVEAALWAWQTFGGVGARTRRGMGAIECTEIDGEQQNAVAGSAYVDSIRKNLSCWIQADDFPVGVPHLSPTAVFKLTGNQNDQTGIEALRNIIGQYKRFRQSRPGTAKDPGRSHWPEADLIKDCFPGRTFRHPASHHVRKKAPRAVFGLPIIIQFKKYDNGLQDPDDTTIQGVGKIDRLASPLIIRPVHLAEGFAGMAVLLEWDPLNPYDEAYTPPGGLAVMQGIVILYNPSTVLTSADAMHIQPLNGNPNPLTKFIDSIN